MFKNGVLFEFSYLISSPCTLESGKRARLDLRPKMNLKERAHKSHQATKNKCYSIAPLFEILSTPHHERRRRRRRAAFIYH
jgi:hypothetical protein